MNLSTLSLSESIDEVQEYILESIEKVRYATNHYKRNLKFVVLIVINKYDHKQDQCTESKSKSSTNTQQSILVSSVIPVSSNTSLNSNTSSNTFKKNE